MNLIGRYIFREALASTAVVMVVLLVIFMSNQFAETLAEAAADTLPRDAVFRVFGLQFLRYLSLLAPVGLLLGVLLALARLNRDSEMAALSSCGIGPLGLLRPIGLLSLLVATGVGWLALEVAPAAGRSIEEIRHQAQEELELGALTPGRFTSLDTGDTVLYARDGDGDSLEGVFIQQRDAEGRIIVVVAEEGERVQSSEDREFMLVLRNGRRYVGVPGEARFQVTEFGGHGMPIRIDETELVEAVESRSTQSLLEMPDAVSRAELQWRVAAPISIVVLALLAVPLGRASPREGKYARVGLGLLIYIIYANSLSIARLWVEREVVPPWIGTWWVHGALTVLALVLLMRQSGVGVVARRTGIERREPTH